MTSLQGHVVHRFEGTIEVRRGGVGCSLGDVNWVITRLPSRDSIPNIPGPSLLSLRPHVSESLSRILEGTLAVDCGLKEKQGAQEKVGDQVNAQNGAVAAEEIPQHHLSQQTTTEPSEPVPITESSSNNNRAVRLQLLLICL